MDDIFDLGFGGMSYQMHQNDIYDQWYFKLKNKSFKTLEKLLKESEKNDDDEGKIDAIKMLLFTKQWKEAVKEKKDFVILDGDQELYIAPFKSKYSTMDGTNKGYILTNFHPWDDHDTIFITNKGFKKLTKFCERMKGKK